MIVRAVARALVADVDVVQSRAQDAGPGAVKSQPGSPDHVLRSGTRRDHEPHALSPTSSEGLESPLPSLLQGARISTRPDVLKTSGSSVYKVDPGRTIRA